MTAALPTPARLRLALPDIGRHLTPVVDVLDQHDKPAEPCDDAVMANVDTSRDTDIVNAVTGWLGSLPTWSPELCEEICYMFSKLATESGRPDPNDPANTVLWHRWVVEHDHVI